MARHQLRSTTLWLFLVLIMVALGLGVTVRQQYLGYLKSQELSPTEVRLKKASPPLPAPVTSASLPLTVSINAPFTVQAPLGRWDALHEEACEEASLQMVVHYKNDQPFSSSVATESEIQQLVKWETDNHYEEDLTVVQLQKVAADQYGLKSRVVNNPTIIDIKQAIAAKHLVVVPVAGQVLANPHFTPPGPVYHMLVIRGYTQTEFITNDPGTKFGENYQYTFSHLLESVHDWNPNNILNGPKKVLVF